jgi:hypothetical protein
LFSVPGSRFSFPVLGSSTHRRAFEAERQQLGTRS